MLKATLCMEMPQCCEIGNNLDSEIQVIPFGTHETDRGSFTLDSDGASEVLKDFESRTNDMVVDYEHQSLGSGEAPAAGWIKKLFFITPHSPLSLRGDEGGLQKAPGIWAAVEWTPRALQYLRNREYRYLSPVFMKRASDDRVVRLLGAALTNTPAIDGMVPLVNKGSLTPDIGRKEAKCMKQVLSALGLTAGATEEEAIKSIDALKARAGSAAAGEILKALGLGTEATASEAVGAVLAMKQSSELLKGVSEEMEALRAKIAATEGQALVSQAMSLGKITPAQREWAEAYAQRDPEGFKVFVAKSPMVVPRGAVSALPAEGPAAPGGATQASVNRLLMVSDEAFRKFSATEQE